MVNRWTYVPGGTEVVAAHDYDALAAELAALTGDAYQARVRDQQARIAALESALRNLLADLHDYPAWERPCHAFDAAVKVLNAATAERDEKHGV